VFTLTMLDLRSGEQLLRQEMPFLEQVTHVRKPRWTNAKSVELVLGDYLYRVAFKY
jgi:hypothetical protein